jgi:hypothetical protein
LLFSFFLRAAQAEGLVSYVMAAAVRVPLPLALLATPLELARALTDLGAAQRRAGCQVRAHRVAAVLPARGLLG